MFKTKLVNSRRKLPLELKKYKRKVTVKATINKKLVCDAVLTHDELTMKVMY